MKKIMTMMITMMFTIWRNDDDDNDNNYNIDYDHYNNDDDNSK